MMALTARQREVLRTLDALIAEHGESPTIRQLCEQLGRSSTSTIHAQLRALERKGYIRLRPRVTVGGYEVLRRPSEPAA